ncbi:MULTISPECIES: hypothetical protein [Tissierella]|nr:MULTISPECIES: hypothetical protein [Tissierella]
MNNKNKGFLLISRIALILTSCSNSKSDNLYKKLAEAELVYTERFQQIY